MIKGKRTTKAVKSKLSQVEQFNLASIGDN